MTSIPDSVKSTLDTNWTGAGGTEPTYYVSEDFRTDPPLGKDGIWIPTSTLKTKIVPVNDTYSNKTHTLEIITNTQTDEDRLKEIADEIERILNANVITGATYQKVIERKNYTGQYKGIWVYQEVLTVEIREQLASSASAYGAGSAQMTQAQLEDMLMYGSANAAYVPCVFEHQNTSVFTTFSGMLSNSGGTDGYAIFRLPLPPVKGSLKLYVSNIRISISDADSGDMVINTWVYGQDDSTPSTTLYASGTDLDSAGDKESGDELGAWGAADDCSSYVGVVVQLQFTFTNANDFELPGVSLECYYA